MEKLRQGIAASSPMSWRVALHHRLPAEPPASPQNARSPARALLSTEPRTTWQGPDQRSPPARPERARRKLSLLPAVQNPSPAHLVTANYSATKLDASRLTLHITIIAARDPELTAENARDPGGKFILKKIPREHWG